MERHGANIKIASDFLLKLLDFQDGSLWGAGLSDDGLSVVFTIEHPDLPLFDHTKGEATPEVRPEMTVTYGDNGVPIKLERTRPTKKANSLEAAS